MGSAGSASFEERVRRALGARAKRAVAPGDRRAAAVLILLFERDGEPWAVFTRRTDRVRHHKGEISFPGGARDDGDADLAATALRETEEELGLDPADVCLLGELDDLPTFATQYVVSPYVALIAPDRGWRPNEHEIAEVIEAPLRDLARAERMETWSLDGGEVSMYFYPVGEQTIWGATARILHQLLEVAGPALGI